ncbi:FadR/GntR family transcriptional regulator [Paramicrobacterium agarici]|uniref:GntR family transcriptional regulator n=1 Tax=Paramicrobacterium agarici TaxID=630514 RepID=A0A2A9E0A0_9MICO|nr:FCD domain-containing protein [Microbacterium agarici]PFG31805.1 GntR family transcriptional regulator [Microbacterium agarici]TQO21702.1 GntR family transcriptional regulator [Microbacterium agarici]
MPGSLHDRVLDALGESIVSGELAPGTVMRAEQIEHEHGVSRSVVREAVRVLQSLGLLTIVKRVGITVLASENWRVFDPFVIRWRLAGERGAQLRSLTELRCAVEPSAAELAARHAPDAFAEPLVSLAARMRSVGRSGDLDAFLELDIEFHSRVLAASGNEMFAALDSVIAEVLRGRTELGLMPEKPHEEALALHLDVADAVHGRRPAEAHEAMDQIMRRTVAEVEGVWQAVDRVFR